VYQLGSRYRGPVTSPSAACRGRIAVFHQIGFVDSLKTLDPVRRSSLAYLCYMLPACVVAILILDLWLIPQRLVSDQDWDLAYWLLILLIQYITLTVRGLIKGEDLKVGKYTFSHSRNARIMILGLSFAFLGYLVGGRDGVFVGVLIATGISTVVQYLNEHRNRSREETLSIPRSHEPKSNNPNEQPER